MPDLTDSDVVVAVMSPTPKPSHSPTSKLANLLQQDTVSADEFFYLYPHAYDAGNRLLAEKNKQCVQKKRLELGANVGMTIVYIVAVCWGVLAVIDNPDKLGLMVFMVSAMTGLLVYFFCNPTNETKDAVAAVKVVEIYLSHLEQTKQLMAVRFADPTLRAFSIPWKCQRYTNLQPTDIKAAKPQEAAMEKWEAMRKAAVNGTGGIWTWEDGPPTLYSGRCGGLDIGCHGLNLLGRLELDWNGKNNLTHIAESSPKNVLDLLAERDALLAVVQECESYLAEHRDEHSYIWERLRDVAKRAILKSDETKPA